MVTVWTYPGSTVQRIVDGDTLIANMSRDCGFHLTVGWVQRFRLNRINAAPGSTDAGRAATAFLTGLLGTAAFTVESVGPYKYGDEWMAELTLPGGANVSDALVTAGVAVYWDGTGPRPGG